MQGTSIENEINGVELVEEVAQEKGSLDLSFLKAQTGEGSIEQYLEHPLNFNKSSALARVIRGLSGLLGSLDLALIDIVVGLLEFIKGRKANAA